MKFLKKLNKFFLISIYSLIFFLLIFFIYLVNSKDNSLTQDRRSIKKIIKNKSLKQNIFNDYNEVFLPKTQFITLDINRYKLNFVKENKCYVGNCYTFYFQNYKDKLFILDKTGNLFYINIKDFLNGREKFKKINLDLNLEFVLDLYIKNNNIYISGNKKIAEDKYEMQILRSSLTNIEKMIFEPIFKKGNEKCINNGSFGGKIQHQEGNINKGLLLTIPTYIEFDRPDVSVLSDKTVCGKILLIDEKNANFEIYSKGFRNSIGLFSNKDVTLATDNGPKGGDEINNIKKGSNYGWPVASYGDFYFRNKDDEKINYKKKHGPYGFQEPIVSFIPSIGISDITSLSNNFSNFWQDNFLVGSLNKKTLYRIKFDDVFNKVIFKEEIFVGDRIRDILYLEKSKTLLLSLELSGEILIINRKKNKES